LASKAFKPLEAQMVMRRFLASLALIMSPVLAHAQSSAIRLMVGFPAGGGTDVIARVLGERLGPLLNATVIVENKAGAGGQIAAQALKTAAKDGSVLFLSHDHTISILPLVLKNPGFQPQEDFVAVAGFASFANGLAVSSHTPVNSYQQYVQWMASQDRDRLAIGVPAPASVPEFLVKALAIQTKLDLQPIPYRGSAPMLIDMLGNQIPAGVASVPDFIEYIQSGKVRMLAVLGAQRQARLPNVPTFAELGFDAFSELPYYGIFAPRGTSVEIIGRLGEAVKEAIAQPQVFERLQNLGLTVEFMSSQALAARERAYTKNWASLIKEIGFVAQ
jgi:tripartite-type tricarboxylate transporter receptor subunit TctC